MKGRISTYFLFSLILIAFTPITPTVRAGPDTLKVQGRVISAAVSSSGFLVYSDFLGYVHMLSPSGNELWKIRVTNATRCAYVDISEDGRVAVLSEGRITVFSQEGRVIWSRENSHEVVCGMVHPIMISPDGSIVVIAWKGDRYVAGFSGTDGKILWHKILKDVNGVYYSPKGRYLAVLEEYILTVFNTTTGERDPRFKEVFTLQPLVDDDGYYAVIDMNTVTLYSPQGDELWSQSFHGIIYGGTFLPDHRKLAITIPIGNSTRVLILDERGNTIEEFRKPFLVNEVGTSPDGSYMVLLGNLRGIYALDETLRKLGDEGMLIDPSVQVNSHPYDEGVLVAVGSIEGISLYDATGRRWKVPLPYGFLDLPTSIHFSYRWRVLTTSLVNGTILVINSTDGSIAWKVDREQSFPMYSIASDDTKYLLAVFDDETVFVYENSNGSAEVLFAKSCDNPMALPSVDWQAIIFTSGKEAFFVSLRGEKKWRFDLDSYPSMLIIVGDRIIISTENGIAYLLSTDGTLIRSYDVKGNITHLALPSESEILLYIYRRGNFGLMRVNMTTGEIIWSGDFDLNQYPVWWLGFCAGEKGILLGDITGKVYSLGNGGSMKQVRELENGIEGLFCGSKGSVLALLTSGEIEVRKLGGGEEGGVVTVETPTASATSSTEVEERYGHGTISEGQVITALGFIGIITLISLLVTWLRLRTSSRRVAPGNSYIEGEEG